MIVQENNLLKKNIDFPLVSVITVTYNASEFISKCIDSVKAQTYPNIEHVIIDGGSTDNTLELVDGRVEFWISEEDKGIYDAMNKSVQFAKGRWILFLGADDTLLSGFSDMCLLLKDKNCIYYGDSKINQHVFGGEFNAYRLAKFNICHQSIFYPRTVFDRYHYNLKYKVRADHDLNIRCYADSNLRFQYYPMFISQFADGGFSSVFEDKAFFKDRGKIIKEAFGFKIYLRYILRRLRHKIKGRKS
ncbi:glycosyltransferase family 2 protein [Pedobacter aquatilis]|uniref:glycosyltransferase family 2 protein n=1 Tax=Pedobacter aquatilis TaxID=351343 RepID=UPI00292D5275|nr:glycosyltransferase family 2 protein [Pedobacter aquatilis]